MFMNMLADYSTILLLTIFACGYITGSVPFGLVLHQIAGLGDLRKIGSGNIGATNVLRTGNKFLALLTLLLDIGKGAAAVFIVEYFYPGLGLFAGAGAFLGHIYSIFLKLSGGKGVATFLGILIALSPLTGLSCCIVWIISAFLFRISSLSAIIAALASPLLGYYFLGIKITILATIMCALIIFKHKDNIRRLMAGTEPKIGNK